jgi:hypothetical protein
MGHWAVFYNGWLSIATFASYHAAASLKCPHTSFNGKPKEAAEKGDWLPRSNMCTLDGLQPVGCLSPFSAGSEGVGESATQSPSA